MSLSDLTSRDAVLAAIAEHDAIGQQEFLSRYGFGPATRYLLEHDGRRYDSKAIAGVAHGKQHPQAGPLRSQDFSGGLLTVTRALEKLGFRIVDVQEAKLPRRWAFCANPSRYQIRDAIEHLETDYWLAERGDIRVRDTVAIWQTLDADGKRGIVGLGEVLSDPVATQDSGNPYWVDQREADQPRLRVPVRYHRIPKPLWIDDTSIGHFLKTLSVARARGGSVFKLTEDQWQELRRRTGMGGPEDPDVTDVESEVRHRGRVRGGQGFGLSVPQRRAVERYAMERAIAYFRTLWPVVTDVSARCSFDLLCRNGSDERRVEVKGTTTPGDQVVLTRRELIEAESPGYTLFVLSDVALTEHNGVIQTGGGRPRVIQAWDRAHHELEPIAYRVALNWSNGVEIELPDGG